MAKHTSVVCFARFVLFLQFQRQCHFCQTDITEAQTFEIRIIRVLRLAPKSSSVPRI